MRWFSYFILAYIALGVQVGIGDAISFRGATPNIALLAAIFIALNAPREAALLGCFGIGVLHDLLTQQPPGVFALSYGIVGLLVSGSNQVVYREHPLTQLAMTLMCAIVVAIVVLLQAWIHPPGAAESVWVGGQGPTAATQVSLVAVRPSPTVELLRAAYTAALAPVVLGLLQRIKRAFSFQPGRRKLANRN